ncbi:fibronectin type-III domain-containing protein 3A-like [Pygocentrus nattereri]|uniref:Fibronectin type-III domain-containing protein n=1 Tax=Pygocentrus nattereri TaxID=42514 RepID=A0A3B4DS47_PYGNA|nr:fibronectin type-III domain-containing protein 3A-like [Pygocentrus nattereri]XP_017579027.1 fibronectin type-III domain-containing protein 3A-like [Pygocentrus nattereri]
MMTDQHLPLLEATPMLAEVPLLPHVISGDGMQQMILVQVNPGETFTIRTEDGHFQCITGPAQVPMVSPNGTMPPIFVPPGYVSQVVEENGMRKVLVLPHAMEFHPSLPPVPPHLPLYASPHPAMLHHPHVFPTELPHYVHQLPALPVYSEQDMMCHSMSVPIHEERSVKMQEQLQRRLKSGHLGTANGVPFSYNSPGPFIKGGQAAMHNGNSKGRTGLAASPTPPRLKHSGRTRGSPTSSFDVKDPEEEVRRVQELLSAVCKPAVGSLTSHSAVLSWRPPLPLPSEVDTHSNTRAHTALLLSYELALSQSGTEGDFKLVYQGKDTTCTVGDLRPAAHYYARVCVACSSVKGAPSETVAFTTLCGTPDAPAAPRLIQRTKSSISLQWTSPNDNGSKITGFYLEYHEQGKQSAFKEVYSGLAKQYKVMRLMPSTKYAFRLAAKNDVGMSAFSAVLSCCTASCSASPPAPPSPPRLTEAGVTWLSLEWGAPCGSASRDTPTYILEMEDKESDCGFQLKHRGEEQSCTVKELRRFTSYQFRVLVAGSEGTSQPSSAVEYRTQPAQPGSPGKPSLRCPAEPHSLHVIWEAPEDDGGSPVTQYVLELSHSGDEWEAVYSGSLRQHVCEGLQEGTWYKLRVHCQSSGGQSQVSEIFSVETPPLPPGPCQALRTAGAAATSEIPLCWDPPVCDGGAPVSQYCVEMTQSAEEYQQQVFCGSDRCCTVSQLLPGRTYLFWVKACNPAGWGPLSEMCQASTAPGPPEQCSAPQLILNTSTSGLATWQTPEGNGAEVCAFRMEWGLQEGALELLYSGPLTQYEVSDLQPATEYRCRVQAVSAVGAGLFSDVATVTTPASVPAAVEHVEEMREGPLGDVMAHSPATTLALRWKEPNCHGAEISSYNIDIGEELPLSTGRTSYHILENLQPDTTYRIRVQAVNSMGAGPFSSVLKLRTRALPPEPPVLECAVAGPQSLKLKWGEGLIRPQTSRGTHYCLHMQLGVDRSICIYSGPSHTFKVQRLCEATDYQFSIQAHSEAGMGPLSPSYTFSTTRSPPPQLKAPKVELIERNKYAVTWEAHQPMKGDLIVYKLQMLRGREVEQLYKGPVTSYTWHNTSAGVACRLRVYAGRRSQDGSELWGQCSLSTGLPATEPPREHRISSCHEPQPRRSWPLTDEPFATVLLLGFVVLAVLFAVLIQYFVIERE